MENIVRQGPAVIAAHLEHLLSHGEQNLYTQAIEFLHEHQIPVPGKQPGSCGDSHGHHPFAGCPGAAARTISRPEQSSAPSGAPRVSELKQWPVQLRLLNPGASYFDNADILVAADCVPFAYAGFHEDFLKGKIVIIFCPKLDADITDYIEKMTAIFTNHAVRSVTMVHMEVPCCSGITHVVNQALARSGKHIPVHDVTITITGTI